MCVMSHMHESCPIRISHLTCEWVTSCTNKSCHVYIILSHTAKPASISASCHIWKTHVTYYIGMSHMNESCHIWMSHVAHRSISIGRHAYSMSHMDESCHIWMRHVMYEWVMPHTNASEWAGVCASCHTWMSHVTYEWSISCMNGSCHV